MCFLVLDIREQQLCYITYFAYPFRKFFNSFIKFNTLVCLSEIQSIQLICLVTVCGYKVKRKQATKQANETWLPIIKWILYCEICFTFHTCTRNSIYA